MLKSAFCGAERGGGERMARRGDERHPEELAPVERGAGMLEAAFCTSTKKSGTAEVSGEARLRKRLS